MNANKALAIMMVILACALGLLAVVFLIFIPFATEIEDALGPLAGSTVCLISATALLVDSREFLDFWGLPRASGGLLHSVNCAAISVVAVLAAPSVLQDPVMQLETRILLIIGSALLVAYILAAKVRHTSRPWF